MADRVNVIKGLECCIKKHCNECPYKKITKTESWQNDCNEELTVDILALLKEQQKQIQALKKNNNYLKNKVKDQRALIEAYKTGVRWEKRT